MTTIRVAGLGRLSAGANMAMKPFVKRVITIFATNASFLRVIAKLQILLSKICNKFHVIDSALREESRDESIAWRHLFTWWE